MYEWGANPRLARSAVDILRRDGAPGWAEDLDAVINGDPQLLSSIWFGVSGTTAPLRIPAVRDSMSPGPGENFDMDAFLRERNSLYLIGTGTGAGAAGGFLGGLMDSITEHARRTAQRSATQTHAPPAQREKPLRSNRQIRLPPRIGALGATDRPGGAVRHAGPDTQFPPHLARGAITLHVVATQTTGNEVLP